MSVWAVWIADGTSEERPLRLIRRAPDRITEFGSARILSATILDGLDREAVDHVEDIGGNSVRDLQDRTISARAEGRRPTGSRH